MAFLMRKGVREIVSVPERLDWLLVVSIHLLYTWTLPPTPGDTVGRSLMVLGPFQTQSNGISDEKTIVGSLLQK